MTGWSAYALRLRVWLARDIDGHERRRLLALPDAALLAVDRLSTEEPDASAGEIVALLAEEGVALAYNRVFRLRAALGHRRTVAG